MNSVIRVSRANWREFVCCVVVEACPLTFTGADFYALCSDALLCAMKEEIDRLESLPAHERELEMERSNAQAVVVEQRHFFEALKGITPSVSEADMERYRRVQAQYANTATTR